MAEALSTIPAHRRRLLLVGTEADRARLKLNRENRRLLIKPSLRFVSLDEVSQFNDPILQDLASKDLLQPGALLVQSLTVPNKYARLSSAGDQTAKWKLDATVRVCHLLGARRVEIRHAEFKSREDVSKRTASTQAKGIAQGKINTASGTIEVGGLQLRAIWTFHGGEPQTEEADRALAESGLLDEALQSMIDFFRTGNWPTSYEFEISTTEEMRRMREMVGDMSVPATFKAHTELESFKASASSYRFQLWVEFG